MSQKVIPKEAGCSQSTVYIHINGKLSGKKKYFLIKEPPESEITAF